MSQLNCMSFSNDSSALCVGYKDNGCAVYSLENFPFPRFDRGFRRKLKLEGKVKQMVKYYDSSLLGVVMAEEPNKVLIYSLNNMNLIHTFEAPAEILALKMNGERIVTICETSIAIYDLLFETECHSIIDVYPNKNKVFDFSTNYLAYPDGPGQIHIFDAVAFKSIRQIDAHKSDISMVALSLDQTLVATASNVGTIVCVFDVESGVKIMEFRLTFWRNNGVNSIAFSPCSMYLAVASCWNIQIFPLPRKIKDTVASDSGVVQNTMGWMGAVTKPITPTAITRWWNQENAASSIHFAKKIEHQCITFKHYHGKLHILSASSNGTFSTYKLDEGKCGDVSITALEEISLTSE